MFGNRRRRAASNPSLNGSNVNPSATAAAAQAFLKGRASNASLSSAAAATALRSRPTSPTSVADVQTKRTIRRSASINSVGSSVSASMRPGLERRGSSSSMTERTFRSPSPSRSQGVPSTPDAPPVPVIPQHMQQIQRMTSNTHRRASSLEVPPMRIASPPPNPGTGRGSSLGPTGTGTMQPTRRHEQRSSLSSVQELTGAERQSRRGSVNFSLPTSSRPTSPVGQKWLTYPSPQSANLPTITSPNNQALVYDPNTRSFLPPAELRAIEMRIQAAATQPTNKKRRAPLTTGTHLADGTVGGRPRGTAVDAMEARAQTTRNVEQPSTAPPTVQPIVKRKKKRTTISELDSDEASQMSASDNDSIISQPTNSATRAGGLLAKKPSIVREDREREEAEDDTPRRPNAADGFNMDTNRASVSRTEVSPSPLPGAAGRRGHGSTRGRGQASASAAYPHGLQPTRAASQPPLESGLVTSDSTRVGRVQSVSPARTTHFATRNDNLVVRHQPPPRSVSPRKSALKHSNSSREQSPIELPRAPVNQHLNETSIGVNLEADDVAERKRKANRVSFDETNVIVGQAAPQFSSDSPVVPSPQGKRSWFSIGRGKRKDTTPIEDDEVMMPRPALPSFGSVREKKTREAEPERVLVKPAEFMDHQPPLASPPILPSADGEAVEYPLGQSSDHVVGAVLSQDAASKNIANMAKSREPLPPQVTSVEGSGYVSDSDSSSYSLENKNSDMGVRGDSVKRGPDDADSETSKALARPTVQDGDLTPTEKDSLDGQVEYANGKTDIPEIAIQAPTPKLEETREWFEMPGAWESSDSGSQSQEHESPAAIVEHHATDPSPADVGIAEPAPDVSLRSGSPPAQISHSAILEEPEESDASSIYSDAAEDLSDLDGDGFMSLNAVVESPIPKIVAPVGLAITTEPESPTTKRLKEKAYKRSGLSRRDSEPGVEAGWDKAQEYWSSLSAEKKRQIELDAQEEAEEEAEGSDTEVEVKPTPKPTKKKKKVVAQPTTAEQVRQVQQAQPPYRQERTYMISPGSKATLNGQAPLKSSMRPEPPRTAGDARIRKSMRIQSASPMKGSMRGSSETAQPKGSLQKKYRPMSLPPAHDAKSEHDEAVRQHVKALSIASAAAASKKGTSPTVQSPTLRRRGSGDSQSSFKRARAGSDVPSFRRSMRASEGLERGGRGGSPTRGSSRFSLRSLSPSGSAFRRPFSPSSAPPASMSQSSMRRSLRTPESPSKGIFGRSGGSKAVKKAPLKTQTSRFAYSSDEEDEPRTFRSRFVDSSDEDELSPVAEPPGLRARTMRASTPVRGIPKRAGAEDGDSSDLPDSDDDQPISPSLKVNKKKGQNGSAATTSNQGATLASGSVRRSGSGRSGKGVIIIPPAMANGNGDIPATKPNQNRRGSLLSILRRKKPDPNHKVRKSDAESPARRDTPLERSKSDLAAIKHNSRATSPKLQKRNSHNASLEGNGAWPLPAALPSRVVEEDKRPFTADEGNGVVGASAGASAGVNGKEVNGKEVNGKEVNGNEVNGVNGDGGRPGLGTRRFTATGLADVDLVDGGRKKKFGRLRRLFRLDD